ncbi:MAG: HAD family hydrolase [Actinomycetota bacterium]|nr:HAD family hydrolase [Actinomycetota bacterium]
MAGRFYDAVFLDVDGTLLWVDLDVRGYVEDLAPYSTNGPLTVERAAGPVWAGMKEHISQNIHHRTREDLDRFKRRNQQRAARTLGLDAPPDLLAEVSERRISFNPYPESETVMEELRGMGLKLYVVSNWDVLLEEVLEELGWMPYFEGVIASAVVGIEKPAAGIFEEALRASGVPQGRVVHVGNDPEADVRGAANSGLDAVFVNRGGDEEAPEATATIPDLRPLPDLLGERGV